MATTEFQDAADHQAKALGFDPMVVWLPHPIQNRTGEELEALAQGALDPILKALVSA